MLVVALGVGITRASSGTRQAAVEWLAFTSERDAAVADIALISLDGAQRINLTRGRTSNQIGPSWSPEGRRLVFYGGRLPMISLYTIEADGSGLQRLLGRQSRFDINPAWSPDGRWIAFVRSLTPAGQQHTFAVRPDGSGLRRFSPRRIPGTPAWSPDGRKIAFVEFIRRRGADGRIHSQSEIFIVNADGTALRRLTHSPKEDVGPAWSPDGKRIAFTTSRNARLLEQDDVYVMNADGTEQTQLTENQAPIDGDGLLGSDFGPTWSPDGTRIAFTSARDGNFEIYLMNADGSCETRLTRTPRIDEFDLSWRPTRGAWGRGPLSC